MKEKPINILGFSATERGNVYLTHVEENYHNAWLRLPAKNHWLQIAIRSDNYPALDVTEVEMTDKELSQHICKHFGGGMWTANKMNLEGVKVREDYTVIGDDDE